MHERVWKEYKPRNRESKRKGEKMKREDIMQTCNLEEMEEEEGEGKVK